MRPTLTAHLWRRCLGAILGATIVGAQAGELITNFTVAVQSNGAIGAVEIAKAIAPYPTNAEAIKYCCNQYNIQVRVLAIVEDTSLLQYTLHWSRAANLNFASLSLYVAPMMPIGVGWLGWVEENVGAQARSCLKSRKCRHSSIAQ